MFFQTIYGLLADSTEVGINIKRVNDKLTVAVMPRHKKLKDGASGGFIPLVASGTPEELDCGFANIMVAPVAKAVGIMTNLKEFERQAEKAAAKGKPKAAAEKETKEAKETKEKNDRLDKLMKRIDESVTARRFADAMALLKHALTIAPAEKQDAVKVKMQEVRRKSEEGSLFAGQPPTAFQPIVQTQPQQTVQTAAPTPTAGRQHIQPRPVMPAATQPVQTGTMQQRPVQPAPQQPAYATAQQDAAQYGNPQGYGADKDEEYDMDAFREDPYAEYVDFPQECRMRDEAHVEMSFT